MARDPICGMNVDEKQGLKLISEGNTYYFCSEHCLRKFAGKTKLRESEILAACSVFRKVPFYKNKLFIVTAVLALVILISYFLQFLAPFRVSILSYIKTIWWAILLGLFLGGIIDYYIPREYISLILAKPRKKTIFYSVFLGFFASACSHGVLALSIELHKKGASNPAVVSFLLASPWANLTITIMLVGFFGLKAFYIILSAFAIAVTTGLIFQVLEEKNLIERNSNIVHVEKDFSIIKDMKERFRGHRFSLDDIRGIFGGMISLGNMVLWWVVIGMGLASLAGAYIPSRLFHNYMGPTFLGLMVTLALATVIEVCSEGSSPMAFEIYKHTGAFGNSFVFLMAGVVTDYTEIGLIWHNVGRKVALWIPVITVPQVILLGIIGNILF